jgi:flagellar basal body-associated protein FliL
MDVQDFESNRHALRKKDTKMKNILLLILAVLLLPIWLPLALAGGWFYRTNKAHAVKEMKE